MWCTADMVYIGTVATTLLHMILTVMSVPVRTDGRSYQHADNSRVCVSVFTYRVDACLRRIFQLRAAGRRRATTYRTNSLYLNVYRHIYCSEYSDTLQCLHDELSGCDTPDTTSVIQEQLRQPWALTSNQYCDIQVNNHMAVQTSVKTSDHSNNAATNKHHVSKQQNVQPVLENHANKQETELENGKWSKADHTMEASHITASDETNNSEKTDTHGDTDDHMDHLHVLTGKDTRLKYQPHSQSTGKKYNNMRNILQILNRSHTNSVVIFKNAVLKDASVENKAGKSMQRYENDSLDSNTGPSQPSVLQTEDASEQLNYLNEKSKQIDEQSSAISQETLTFESENNNKPAPQTDSQASHSQASHDRIKNQVDSSHQATSENERLTNALAHKWKTKLGQVLL